MFGIVLVTEDSVGAFAHLSALPLWCLMPEKDEVHSCAFYVYLLSHFFAIMGAVSRAGTPLARGVLCSKRL